MKKLTRRKRKLAQALGKLHGIRLHGGTTGQKEVRQRGLVPGFTLGKTPLQEVFLVSPLEAVEDQPSFKPRKIDALRDAVMHAYTKGRIHSPRSYLGVDLEKHCAFLVLVDLDRVPARVRDSQQDRGWHTTLDQVPKKAVLGTVYLSIPEFQKIMGTNRRMAEQFPGKDANERLQKKIANALILKLKKVLEEEGYL